MTSREQAYEPPRLPTFLERKRARERALIPTTEESRSPIDRWAIRDPPTSDGRPASPSPALDRPPSSVSVASGTGVSLWPSGTASVQNPGFTRRPLPSPKPSRDRMRSPHPPAQLPAGSFSLDHRRPIPEISETPGSIAYADEQQRRAGTIASNAPHLTQQRLATPPPQTRSPRPLPQPSAQRASSTPSYAVPASPFSNSRWSFIPSNHLTGSFNVGKPDPLLARSDTVTSVKSLDPSEMSTSGARPLPRPPTGVGPSRSLDRGIGDVAKEWTDGEQGRRRVVRRSSRSTIMEEERGSQSSVGREENSASPVVTADPGTIIPSFSFGEDMPGATPARDCLPPASSEGDRSSGTSPQATGKVPATIIPSFAFDTDGQSSPEDKSVTLTEPVRTRIAHAGPGVFCAACDRVILGKVLTAMGGRWHPDCFRCSACEMLLEHVSSYDHEGQAYCHMDYHDRFAPKCYHCGTAIVDSRFVTIDDPDPTFGVRHYHELHFFCGECGDPFLDPAKSSAAGTEASRISAGEGEDETKEFVLHGKHAFCSECDIKLHKPKCRSCRKPIREGAVETMGLQWHKDCFRCAKCHGPFANNCFFPKDGKAFCQDCFTG